MDTKKPAPAVPTRRAFLRGAGLTLGATAIAVPATARAAAGQEDTTTTTAGGDTTAGATTTAGGVTTAAPETTTTTTLPRRPEPGDVELLVFAQSLELAAVGAYGLIVDSGLLDEERRDVARLFQRHHQEHADAMGGLASSAARNVANDAYEAEFAAHIEQAADQNAALEIALDIENRAAAFYLSALESIVALEPAALVASILPADGRHAVVLAEAMGLDLADYAPPLQEADDAPTPTEYPLDNN